MGTACAALCSPGSTGSADAGGGEAELGALLALGSHIAHQPLGAVPPSQLLDLAESWAAAGGAPGGHVLSGCSLPAALARYLALHVSSLAPGQVLRCAGWLGQVLESAGAPEGRIELGEEGGEEDSSDFWSGSEAEQLVARQVGMQGDAHTSWATHGLSRPSLNCLVITEPEPVKSALLAWGRNKDMTLLTQP